MTPRPTIVILGPTASGKSALAMALAARLPGGGTCISADSMQVYRGMDIGTAKPTAEERAGIPHELLDVADPGPCDESHREPGDPSGCGPNSRSRPFTVDRWLALARDAEARAREQGRWPILVGGTNLYVKAFLDGLFQGPPADPSLRACLEALSPAALRRDLERCDPIAAARIHRNDRRRTIRALEVFRTTGKAISALQTQWRDGGGPDAPDRLRDLRLVGLDFSVEAINRRINARVRGMMERGFLDEVRRLHEAGALGPQAREALGYKQLLEHLEGRTSLEQAIEDTKIASRRFAKQQRTWLRRFRALPNSRWFDGEDQDLAEKVLKWLNGHA